MGSRIREVGLNEATPHTREIYKMIFSDRDDVGFTRWIRQTPNDRTFH